MFWYNGAKVSYPITEFYKLKRPRDAAQVLNDLIDLLESLQSQPTKAPDVDALTSAQISGTLYLSRLALSRLYLIYWDDQSLELARKLFVRALHGKWKIDEQHLNELAAVSTCTYYSGIIISLL
jgi:hypothetical protein